jgi:arginine N-succinyltransferase
VLECYVSDLRTVRESVVVPVAIGAPADADGVRSLVSNTSMLGFRVGMAPGGVEAGAMRLSADDAAALEVREGDLVRVLMSSNKPKKD